MGTRLICDQCGLERPSTAPQGRALIQGRWVEGRAPGRLGWTGQAWGYRWMGVPWQMNLGVARVRGGWVTLSPRRYLSSHPLPTQFLGNKESPLYFSWCLLPPGQIPHPSLLELGLWPSDPCNRSLGLGPPSSLGV